MDWRDEDDGSILQSQQLPPGDAVTKQHNCEFFLLRYVPNALREEFVNIGIVLRESVSGDASVRFAPDWKRVRSLDPHADFELLDGLAAELRARLAEPRERDTMLHLMEDSFSSSIRLSPKQAVLTDSPEQELRRLSQTYLETTSPPDPQEGEEGGRPWIFSVMRLAFERVGAWTAPQFRHNIAVAQYTRAGDPLRLDCGYRPDGTVKLFHAVSLKADPNLAKVLAYSYPQVREGIAKAEKAEAHLTVIIGSDLDHSHEGVAFALDTLVASNIAVATTAQMGQIAETARRELRV
jgi:hypothetical protein